MSSSVQDFLISESKAMLAEHFQDASLYITLTFLSVYIIKFFFEKATSSFIDARKQIAHEKKKLLFERRINLFSLLFDEIEEISILVTIGDGDGHELKTKLTSLIQRMLHKNSLYIHTREKRLFRDIYDELLRGVGGNNYDLSVIENKKRELRKCLEEK